MRPVPPDSESGSERSSPTSIEFVPVGYAAAAYVLRDRSDRPHFLKLWPSTNAGLLAAARPDAPLPLMVALAEQGIPVAAPIPARDGALSARLDDQPFALFPFVAGRAPPPWSGWPAPLQAALGRTLAATVDSLRIWAETHIGTVEEAQRRYDRGAEPDLAGTASR